MGTNEQPPPPILLGEKQTGVKVRPGEREGITMGHGPNSPAGKVVRSPEKESGTSWGAMRAALTVNLISVTFV